MRLLEDLRYRGQLHQTSAGGGEASLESYLEAGPRKVYAGFDPTSNSLTIGNLVPLLLLRRFQLAGHTPVVVMGGGTGLVGDPSGKSSERPVLDRNAVEANVRAQRLIYERVLSFEGDNAAVIVNNADWLCELSYMQVLRDIGKHFSVNMMIQKDSVRERLKNREQGISYTEFSYLILQAYDFLYLYEEQGVTLQLGGSDQWGNIVAGVELVRRKHQQEVFGVTAPLVTKRDGGKFGKTESGAVWLSPERTSPYAFYQFWLNAADDDAVSWLKRFTFLEPSEIEAVVAEHLAEPHRRLAQKTLAESVTRMLHGSAALESAQRASAALFSGEVSGLELETLLQVFEDAPSSRHGRELLVGEGCPLVDLLVAAQVVKSKREARQMLDSGAISVNGQKGSTDTKVNAASLLHDSVLLVRRGRKSWHVLRWD